MVLKIGDTAHSSSFGSLNLMCHTCGAVGYHIDCNLTYIGKETKDGVIWRRFSISNLKQWICDCPAETLALCKEGSNSIELPITAESKLITPL